MSVEVTDYRPFYILGEVNKPGQYAYVNDMSALNAVALGGGYTVKAAIPGCMYAGTGKTKKFVWRRTPRPKSILATSCASPPPLSGRQ